MHDTSNNFLAVLYRHKSKEMYTTYIYVLKITRCEHVPSFVLVINPAQSWNSYSSSTHVESLLFDFFTLSR